MSFFLHLKKRIYYNLVYILFKYYYYGLFTNVHQIGKPDLVKVCKSIYTFATQWLLHIYIHLYEYYHDSCSCEWDLWMCAESQTDMQTRRSSSGALPFTHLETHLKMEFRLIPLPTMHCFGKITGSTPTATMWDNSWYQRQLTLHGHI